MLTFALVQARSAQRARDGGYSARAERAWTRAALSPSLAHSHLYEEFLQGQKLTVQNVSAVYVSVSFVSKYTVTVYMYN